MMRRRMSVREQMARRRTLNNLKLRRGLLTEESRELERLDNAFYMREYRRV